MVSPAKLEIKAKPGATVTKFVKVANQGGVPIRIDTSIADYSIRPDNTFVFYKAGQTAYSSAKWLTIDKPVFDLGPDEERTVKIRMTVPKNVEVGGHYSSVFFQTAGPKVSKTGVSIVARIGVLLLAQIGEKKDLHRLGFIKSFKTANPWWSRKVKTRLVFHNSGNVHLTLKGQTVFKDIFGRQVGRADFPSITLLPKTDRVVTAEWEGPIFGFFSARAKTAYGADIFTFDHAETSEARTVWIIPWLYILLLLGVSVAMALVRKLARKKTYVGKHTRKRISGRQPVQV